MAFFLAALFFGAAFFFVAFFLAAFFGAAFFFVAFFLAALFFGAAFFFVAFFLAAFFGAAFFFVVLAIRLSLFVIDEQFSFRALEATEEFYGILCYLLSCLKTFQHSNCRIVCATTGHLPMWSVSNTDSAAMLPDDM